MLKGLIDIDKWKYGIIENEYGKSETGEKKNWTKTKIEKYDEKK